MNQNDRVQLTVMGISYSPLQSGAFAMLLAQVDGPYRIPVVIGASEAQSIAIQLESIVTPRPMTHDLFSAFAKAFGVKLIEAFIYKFEEGIFSSELRFSDGEREVTIDSRTSDAVAIALRLGAPIFTTQEILYEAGAVFEESGDDQRSESQANSGQKSQSKMSKSELQQLLDKYIKEENYEEAARISQRLKDLDKE